MNTPAAVPTKAARVSSLCPFFFIKKPPGIRKNNQDRCNVIQIPDLIFSEYFFALLYDRNEKFTMLLWEP